MQRVLVTLASVGLVAAVATTAGAQVGAATAVVGPRIGVHGGISLLQGSFTDGSGDSYKFSDYFSSGYTVGGHVELYPAALPVGVRLSIDYDRWKPKDEYKDQGLGDLSVTAGELDAIFKFPGVAVSPYIIGGVSFDHLKSYTGTSAAADDSDSSNKFGIGAGGGVMFGLSGFNAFAEAKYRVTFGDNDQKFKRIPIIFGLSFGL